MIRFVLIMAAGRGMRMMPLTQFMPKPLLELDQAKLISYALDQVIHNVEITAITVGYLGGDLAKYAIEKGVQYIFNTNGRGNSWWLFNTIMKNIDEPVLVLTCDNIVELDLQWIYQQYQSLDKPACMLVPVEPVWDIEGDYIIHENQVVTHMGRNIPGERYASGIQLLNPKRINECIAESNYFNDLWTTLISIGQLYCADNYLKPWFSINTPDQFSQATKILKQHD